MPRQNIQQARNGAVAANLEQAHDTRAITSSPILKKPASPAPAEKKQGIFGKMASKLAGHSDSSSSSASRSANGSSPKSSLQRSSSQNQHRNVSRGSSTGPTRVQQEQQQQQQQDPASVFAAPPKNTGPVFGVPISDGPPLAYAVSIIGGQRHQLPILVFSLVEAIFRRGLDTAGIFRINGNPAAIDRLVQTYDTYPSYGDDIDLDKETIFTLCDLLKRYLRDLPEPVLSKEVWPLFVAGCLTDTGADEEKEHVRKLAAAQIILRL